MSTFFDFIKSDVGISIAWISSIVSTALAITQSNKNRKLKKQINNSTTNTDKSQDNLTQIGEKNIYTKTNNGDMNINM